MVSIFVLFNTKFHNTLGNFYFEVILVQDPVTCKVTNVTNRYMNFILDRDKEFDCKDLYVLTPIGSTIINQKFVDNMFSPIAAAIQKWNFPIFFGHKRDPGMGLLQGPCSLTHIKSEKWKIYKNIKHKFKVHQKIYLISHR